MSSTAIERQKYLALMAHVEELEDQVDALEKGKAPVADLRALQEKLAAARTELTRVSDGCGKVKSI
jgi:outer membrane murein-binding lipoprotein Lpp